MNETHTVTDRRIQNVPWLLADLSTNWGKWGAHDEVGSLELFGRAPGAQRSGRRARRSTLSLSDRTRPGTLGGFQRIDSAQEWTVPAPTVVGGQAEELTRSASTGTWSTVVW